MPDRRPARRLDRFGALALAALVAAPCSLAARPAFAQAAPTRKPEAEVRFQRGLEYYKLKEYEAAIQEFEAAYQMDPRPEILFAVAQAERLSGDCESAALLYRRFLETNPPATHADAARASLEKCETALSSRPEAFEAPKRGEAGRRGARSGKDAAAPAAPVAKDPPVAPSPQEPSPRARRPFWKDALGDGLAGGGLVALGVGATFFALSASDARDADGAPTWSQHQRLYDRAETRRAIAWVGLGAGAALVTGAVLRWTLVGSGGERDALTVRVDAGPGMVGLSVSGTR